MHSGAQTGLKSGEMCYFSDIVTVEFHQHSQDVCIKGWTLFVLHLPLSLKHTLPKVVEGLASLLSNLPQGHAMSLYPLSNMLHKNVGLGGDGEGGGGIEGKEGTPQLVQALLPVWMKLQAKNGSVDISDLDLDLIFLNF